MSKVVSGIGRGIKKVLSGIGKAAKKFVKSKIGKVIIGAALIYFTSGLGLGAAPAGAGATGAATAAGTAAGIDGAAALALGVAPEAVAGVAGSATAGLGGTAAAGLGAGITEAGIRELGINTALEAGTAGGIASPGLVAEAAGGASNLAGLGELSTGSLPGVSGAPTSLTGMSGADLATGLNAAGPGVPQGWSLGQALQPLSDAARTASDYMTKNKLWGPAMQLGSGVLQGVGQAGMQRAAYDREDQARQRAYQNWSVGNLILR